MNNQVNNIRQRLTPECNNMANSSMAVALAGIVLSVIVLIVLATYLIYSKKTLTETGEALAAATKKKTTKLDTLISTGIVGSVLSLLLFGWTVMISGKLKSCLKQINMM